MEKLLLELGINVAASAIWDFVKTLSKTPISKSELEAKLSQKLQSYLHINGSEMKSQQIINFLIENGTLIFNGSLVHSDIGILQKTVGSGSSFVKNSKFTTPNSLISIQGNGAFMHQRGNVVIEQSANGISITVSGSKGDNRDNFIMGVVAKK